MQLMFRSAPLIMSLALVASCGSNSSQPSQTTTPERAQWDDDTAKANPKEALPDAAPFVAVGETLTYRVKIRGFAVGEFTVHVGEQRSYQGRQVLPLESSIESFAAMKIVREVHDESVTYMDVETGGAVFFRNDILAGPDQGWVEVSVGDGELQVVSKDKDGEQRHTQKLPLGESVHDMATMLMRLRAWRGDIGERGAVNVFRTSRLWRTQIEIGAKETIDTDLGTFAAIRMDGISRIMTHDFEVETSRDPKPYSVWVSDDGTRLPMIIEGDSEHGSVRMEISGYERDDE